MSNEKWNNMNFEGALTEIKRGKLLARRGWNGKNQWVALHNPYEGDSKMTLPYLYINTVESNFVPWLASQTDLLAEDWEMV